MKFILMLLAVFLPTILGNCRTCRCSIKTESAILTKSAGLTSWNKNICSSGRKTFFGKLLGYISCEKAGRDCPGHCQGAAGVREHQLDQMCQNLGVVVNPGQGMELFYHSQVDCGARSEKHSAMGSQLCCVDIGGRWIGYTQGC
eukprot:GFUD01038365.1.p1 GENE.GFUD01038365.1~~GFUD01038365.1.p1  ORF type:complete len:154 (+),score=22.60 GFUD01038365.1:33-464(+)